MYNEVMFTNLAITMLSVINLKHGGHKMNPKHDGGEEISRQN